MHRHPFRGSTRTIPVTYVLKDEDKEKRHAGIIAQEVEKVVPECVRTMDDGLKGVEYQHLTMMLLKSHQELVTRVAMLESLLQKSG